MGQSIQELPNKYFNLLSANPTKWSNTPKQFVGNTNKLSVFNHFVGLALKGVMSVVDTKGQQKALHISH